MRNVLLPFVSATMVIVAVVANFTFASASTLSHGQRQSLPVGILGAQSNIRVLYNGKTVTYVQLNRTLGATYCDDHLGPAKLTCYSSQRALELATLAEGGYIPSQARQVERQLGVAVRQWPTHHVLADPNNCHPYVIADLYTLPSRQGSEVTLYCDYSNLATIGWSKKASSGISPNCQEPLSMQECFNLWYEINYIKLQIQLATHASNMAALSMSGNDG
jgi:hypothetical protein